MGGRKGRPVEIPTVRMCAEPACIRPLGHAGDHVSHTCRPAFTEVRVESADTDAVTAALVAESVGYAEGVLEDAQLPWPVETAGVHGELVALSVRESTKLMEWARERIAKAWVMGYAAAMDDLSDREADKAARAVDRSGEVSRVFERSRASTRGRRK